MNNHSELPKAKIWKEEAFYSSSFSTATASGGNPFAARLAITPSFVTGV